MVERAEEPEVEAAEALEPTSAAAVALALGRAGKGDKGFDEEARGFLQRQSRLIDLQTEHLHEQRELMLSRLRLGRWKDRASLALQAMTAIVGLAVVVAIAVMAWRAHDDHSLVVEPFSTPPDLAQQGLGGQAFASLLLDRLADMDAKAQAVRAAGSYANSWREDAKVEIPETGVSIGELDRFLRGALGDETRVSGEVFRRAGQVVVSVRASGQPSVSVAGADADLDGIVQRTAEAVYGQTQPYRYSKFLEYQGRTAEARAVAQRLADSLASGPERAWAYAQLANLLPAPGDIAGGVEAGRRAVALNPRLVIGWMNVASNESDLGHDGDAVRDLDHGLAAFAQAAEDVSPEALVTMRPRLQGLRGDLAGDYGGAAAAWQGLYSAPDFQGTHRYALALASAALSKGHDTQGARATLLRGLVTRDTDLLAYMPTTSIPEPVFPEYELAAAAGDWPQAMTLLDQDYAALSKAGEFADITRTNFLDPRRALTLARLGRVAEAQATIQGTPIDCYRCLRVRAQVAAAGGDVPGASRWFARALAQSPNLPQAETEWAEVLLAHGNVDGAVAKLASAHAKNPWFADPLELWGEALMKKSDYAGAAAKFAEADKSAPHWTLNQRLWRQALAKAQSHG